MLGCALLKEKFGMFEVCCILTTVLGVVLIVKPAESLNSSESLAVLAALVGALSWAASGVMSRDLKDIHIFVLLAWLDVIASVTVIAIGLFANAGLQLPRDMEVALLLLSLGVSGYLASITFNLSFMVSNIHTYIHNFIEPVSSKCKESASLIAVVERGLAVLFSYLVQICFFKQVPSAMDIAGSVVITVTVIGIGVRQLLAESGETEAESESLLTVQ